MKLAERFWSGLAFGLGMGAAAGIVLAILLVLAVIDHRAGIRRMEAENAKNSRAMRKMIDEIADGALLKGK